MASTGNLILLIIATATMFVHVSSELRLLMSVYRHGDRYPLPYSQTKSFYPLNPYANVTWGKESSGGLNYAGKKNSYKLGMIIREKYANWLNKLKQIADHPYEFRSSNTPRSMYSATLLAAGLDALPFDSFKSYDRNQQFVDLLPASTPAEQIIYLGWVLCSKHTALLNETKKIEKAMIAYEDKMKSLYDYMSNHTGGSVNTATTFYLWVDTYATLNNGKPVPKWAREVFYNGTLEESAIMAIRFLSWTEKLKRLTGGIWVKRWIDHIRDYLSSVAGDVSQIVQGMKARFYSGHEVNIAEILLTLGAFYPHIPGYASCVNFELHEILPQEYYIKISYRNGGGFEDVLVHGCPDEYCPLETFFGLFARFMDINATEECGTFLG